MIQVFIELDFLFYRLKIRAIEKYTEDIILKIEIKNCNVIIDGKNFFDQPVKIAMRIYNSIRKIAIGQGDDYTTGCLLDFDYFNKYCKNDSNKFK